MKSRKILVGALSLVAPFFCLSAWATHTGGYTEYQRSQAIPFTQCKPTQYDHFYYVEKGQDLSVVIKDIVEDLPKPAQPTTSVIEASSGSGAPTRLFDVTTVITPTSTTSMESVDPTELDDMESLVFSSTSTPVEMNSSNLLEMISTPLPSSTNTPGFPEYEGDKRRKRQAELDEPDRIKKLRELNMWPPQPKEARRKRSHMWEPKPEPEHKVLILLEGGVSEPYTLSKKLELNKVVLGLCTKPPASVPDDMAVPAEKQAVIKVSDSTFVSTGDAAVLTNDGSELYLQSVKIDAHDWSSDYPVLLFLDRSKGVIDNSLLFRLRDNGGNGWGWSLYDYRAIIHLDWWIAKAPDVSITNSRLYQGMSDGANVFGEWGGTVRIENSEQVIANSGISLNLCSAELDVIGGTLSGCREAASREAIANLEGLPETAAEFCPEPGNWSGSCAYYGWDNLVNLQQTTVKGSWLTALTFCDDRLKVQGVENTGNTDESSVGELCSGYLRGEAEGSVGFLGRASCPPGTQFASTQTPEILPTSSNAGVLTTSASEQATGSPSVTNEGNEGSEVFLSGETLDQIAGAGELAGSIFFILLSAAVTLML